MTTVAQHCESNEDEPLLALCDVYPSDNDQHRKIVECKASWAAARIYNKFIEAIETNVVPGSISLWLEVGDHVEIC